MVEHTGGTLTVPETPVAISIPDIFAALDYYK